MNPDGMHLSLHEEPLKAKLNSTNFVLAIS